MSNHISITGNLAAPISLKFTPSGKAVATGRVADTPRRLNRDTQQWEDAGETLWVEFSVWEAEAEALADRAADYRGRVTVTGTLGVRSYEHQGTQRQQLALRADSVALHATRNGARSGSWTADLRAQQIPRGRPAAAEADPWATNEPNF